MNLEETALLVSGTSPDKAKERKEKNAWGAKTTTDSSRTHPINLS